MSAARRLLPSAVTYLALLLGMLALGQVLDGDPVSAAWLVCLAGIVDLVDGAVARTMHVTSDFGRHLDSLSDAVAVGVTPAALLYTVFFHDWGVLGLLVATGWTAAVVTRLARFDADPAPDPDYFVGLPSPLAASVVAGYVVFADHLWGEPRHPGLVLLLVVVLAALMLSRLRCEKAGWFTPHNTIGTWRGRGLLLLMIGVALWPWAYAFVLFGTVVVLMLVRAAADLGGHPSRRSVRPPEGRRGPVPAGGDEHPDGDQANHVGLPATLAPLQRTQAELHEHDDLRHGGDDAEQAPAGGLQEAVLGHARPPRPRAGVPTEP